jgi:hemin uptake protein HemP
VKNLYARSVTDGWDGETKTMEKDANAQDARTNPAPPDDDLVEKSSGPRLPKIVPFRDLCRCGDEVWIEHAGQLYRLRCTKQGKLLLTK